MIGIVVVCHGRLADEFVAALEHIVGPQQNVAAVCIGADDDMELRRRDILDSVAKVDDGDGDGVAVLTDMFGGTPSNLALSVMGQANVEVVAGVNLPMLIRLASIRGNCSLADAVASAQEAGRKYISVASNLLTERNGGVAAKGG
jgi:mannose PTS system EIIA component